MYKISDIDRIKYYMRKCSAYLRGFFRLSIFKLGGGWCSCGKHVELRNIKFLYFKNKLILEDYVELDSLSVGGVNFGYHCRIGRFTSIRATNNIKTPGAGIWIGDNFCCGDWCFFGSNGGIWIGNDVIMGQCIRFHAQNHIFNNSGLIRTQGTTSKGIKIGNNCWIGSGTVFLDGAELGNGCIVAANSLLVNKKYPDDCILMGQPAHISDFRKK